MLDPQRIPLNAERVGFLQRTGQEVDWGAYKQAMQTEYNNQNSAIQVRREREAKKNELHIMGGEGAGFESNTLLLTAERQQRQINGYPLRHFSAESPAVVLPKKYGGFPIYNRNQLEYPELVSVFTEPMSAPLEKDTELLSRAGKVQLSNNASNPYEPESFVNPMNRPMDSIEQNANVFRQRKHLRTMSSKSVQLKQYHTQAGIYINKNGQPVTGASDEVMSDMAQEQMFGINMAGYTQRQLRNLNHDPNEGEGNGGNPLFADNNNSGMGWMSTLPFMDAVDNDIVASRSGDPTSFQDVENTMGMSMLSTPSGPTGLRSASSASSTSSGALFSFRDFVRPPSSESSRVNVTDLYSSPSSFYETSGSSSRFSSPFSVEISPIAAGNPQQRSNILLSKSQPSSGKDFSQQPQPLSSSKESVATRKENARANFVSPAKTRTGYKYGVK